MASTLEAPATSTFASSAADRPETVSQGPRWLAPLVLIATACLGLYVYTWYWQNSRYLWWWIGHDRHTHYMYGLNLAMDVRTGELSRLLHDFDRIRVWGPLHPVLVALIEIVAGPNQRLAVLPSLLGWIMTMWFAFLIPRRIVPAGDKLVGNAAGLIALCLVALSPAHRAYATDVMYESLGAALSLAALYFYLVALQERTPRWGIGLGVILTILFLHKYNYWLLVVFGLLLGEIVRQPRSWFQYSFALLQRDHLPRWLRDECRQPFSYLALAFGLTALVIGTTGGGTIEGFGRPISIQEPHNFIHLAYLAFFVRLVLWWRSTGRSWSRQLPATLREVLLWHGGAIALWFLLPKRLSYFLWYLSPANNDQPRDSVPFLHGLPYYVQGLQNDYLTLSLGIYVCAGMLLLGCLFCRAFRPGSVALLCFFLIGAYLTCQHPMLKNRFMHSWIAAGWILGAAGLMHGVHLLTRRIAASSSPWVTGGVCVLFLGMHGQDLLEPGHAQEGGIKRELPCPLLIPETYLPHLASADHPTIFCNISTRFMLNWTFIEHHHHQRFTADIKNYKANFEDNPLQVQRWLDATRSDTLVLIDVHPGTTFDWKTDEYVDLTTLKNVLAHQSVFTSTQQWNLPEGTTISLWKKNASPVAVGSH